MRSQTSCWPRWREGRAHGHPGRAVSEPLRAEGFEVVHSPLIRIEPFETARACRRLRLAGADEPKRRRVSVPPPRGDLPELPRSGREPPTHCGSAASSRRSCRVSRRRKGSWPCSRADRSRSVRGCGRCARSDRGRAGGRRAAALPHGRARSGALSEADIVLLASPSAARALAATRSDARCVAIGPITAEARRVGLVVAGEAESPTPEEVLERLSAASRSVSSRS